MPMPPGGKIVPLTATRSRALFILTLLRWGLALARSYTRPCWPVCANRKFMW